MIYRSVDIGGGGGDDDGGADAPAVAAGDCRHYRSATSGDGEDEEEEEDFDLPKDLGIRTWTKSLTKEERAKRITSSKAKTAILSVQ